MEIESQHNNQTIEIRHAELPPQYARVPHSSSETLFLFCESGHGIATVNFSRYRICRGSFIPVFSDAYFEINRLSANTRFRLIRLDDKLFDEVAFRLSADFWDFWMDNPVLYLSAEQIRALQSWFVSAGWILSCTKSDIRNFMIHNHLCNLFSALEAGCKSYMENHGRKEKGTAHGILNRFWRLLADNSRLEHEVRFYADKLNITTHYLAKITQKTMHYSPKECIDWQIIMELKQVLKSTDLTIKEIADNFGFESSSYLISYFRRHTGVTPGNFRKHNCSSESLK